MIGDICSKPAVTAVSDTTAHEAAHRMATKKVGALVVVDREGRPKGMVTDRDITVQVVATVLPVQFDEYVWFDETRAVRALPALAREGVPDTYPFGV